MKINWNAFSTVGVVLLSLSLVAAAPSKKSNTGTPSTAKAKTETAPLPSAQPQPLETSSLRELDQAPADPSVTPAGPSATYQIPWQSINGGGAPSSSTNYQVNASVGQSAIGYSTSASYEHGAGYWYGANVATCACPFQADLDGNTFIDAVDLALVIDIVFFGATDITDPTCPASRSDFDFNGFADAVDLALLIDHVFFGGPGPCDPCNPVQSTCS
ncbi:MAG: hypothetical protein AB1752_13200 [Candidatus Zixiibacteriota bacterium]